MLNKLSDKIKNIFNDPFWKNVATLFTGSFIAQALPVLIFPIVTRIYSKDVIGFYFVYAAICGVLQILSTLQYQLAIIIPKSKKEANTIFSLSFLAVLFVSIAVLLVVYFSFGIISQFIETKQFLIWLYAIPISTFFLGLFRISNFYLNREKYYKTIASGKILKTSLFSVLQIILGFLGFLKSGLMISLIIGQVVSGVYLFIMIISKADVKLSFNFKEILIVAKKYKDMPLFNTTIAVISSISNQLPLFFISRYYNIGLSGSYGLSNRVVSTPMELIGTSIGQVFNQESSDTVKSGKDLHLLVKTTYLRLLKLAIIPFFLLFVTSYWLFPFLFGEQYQISGIITMILIPWLFLHFLNSPQNFLFNLLNKQKFMTVYHTLFLLSRLAVLYAGYFLLSNILYTIVLYSLVGIVFNIFLIFYYLNIIKKPFRNNYEK